LTTTRRWCILLDFLQQYVNLILKLYCFHNPLLLYVLQVDAGFVNEHSDTSIIYATEQWLASLYGWTNWSGDTHYITIVTRVNNSTEWLDDHPEWMKWLHFRGDLLSDSTWLERLTHKLTHSLWQRVFQAVVCIEFRTECDWVGCIDILIVNFNILYVQ
jgi:hypothetical protein